MNSVQTNKPIKLQMDKSPKIIGADEVFYALNHEINNPSALGKATPMAANRPACEMDLPAGENYAPNTYYSHLTNELYSWIYNSNGVHFIQRINGDGECEVVYSGCLQLSADPKHQITQWRAYLKVDKLCANRHGKYLVFVDGNNEDIMMIDVEASIATNSFTTQFFDLCGDPCELIKMCVPDPCGCLKGAFVPRSPTDAAKSNNIVDVGIKFSYRHVYYDGRAGIWAEPSTLFYQDTKGCFSSSDGLPRCIKLRVPIGNPLVDKIDIAFWKNGQWFKYDTVDKYKKYNSSQQYWYERVLSEDVDNGTFSEQDCSFDYLFCNDKQCEVIAPENFNRVFNPMPRQAQGLFPIGLSNQEDIALAFYNYKQGSCPIDKFEVDKFDIQLICPEDNCETEFTTIITYAVIHNRAYNRNQPIYRLGGAAANVADDTTDVAYFGGLNSVSSGDLEIGFGQNFKGKTRNFIVYSEGSDYWAEMKQWKADPGFVNKEEWGTIAHFSDGFEKRRWRRAIDGGQYFYQKVELKVARGTRGFLRLASHQATGNEQDGSTFVVGILNNIADYRGNLIISSANADLFSEEIYFDTCGVETLEITKAFIIDDNAIDNELTEAASSYYGYVKDGNGLPVEGAVIMSGIEVSRTDHNGFYHFYKYPGTNDAINVSVLVERDCGAFSDIKTVSITGEKRGDIRQDITIDNEAYKNGLFAIINAKAQDCDGQPVAGLRVALSGSKYKITGTNGIAQFRIRNYNERNRLVRAVLLNDGGCFSINCSGDCAPCMPTETSGTPVCYQNKPETNLPAFTINISSSSLIRNGLKAGGRYPFGFVVKGKCGKQSAVNHIKYLDIPRTQEKTAQGFCTLTYNGYNITLPSWANCVDIVRGENMNPFELQWVVDKIDRTENGKIKLTIQSLNDYNEKYFFKTNTVYQWLKGDRIEFIKNGDGKIFSIAQYGLLNYLTLSPFHDEQVSGKTAAPANFFNQILIADDGRLNDLKEGAVIELQRVIECTTDPLYFGICVSIPVVDGKLLYDSGTFHTFDTYFVNRKIDKFPLQQFEHHSPSDFWGDNIIRLTDTGRPYFINKYENEQRFGRNITINSPTEFNRFGDIVKRFDPSVHGDITAVWITDNKIGLAISEHDNTLFEVGDDLLRVGGDGIVRAATSDQIISDSQPKLSGSFGCQYSSIGSIYFGDGWATFVDVNRHHFVKHNYQQAVAVDIDKCHRYFSRRCQEIETNNRSTTDPLNKLRFATGLNHTSGALHLTIKSLRDSGINNEAAPFEKRNETIMFRPDTDAFLGFASFTPESYGRLNIFDGAGCAFVVFLNGLPYIHPIIPEKYNEFFGVACDWIFGITMNREENKRKRPLSIEVQSDTMFFVKQVMTERANFISEIPPKRWERNGDKWSAAFLGNTNSRGGLYGDEKPTGYYTSVLFTRDNTNDLVYGSINNAKRTAYSELDLISIKYVILEQSGMTANI